MTGRVLTRTFTFETRQHSLFGVDLGEGLPRRALLIAAGLLVAWGGMLWLIFGPPKPYTLFLYVAIPIIVLIVGIQPSPKVARRYRMTDWLLHARYITSSHAGIVNGHIARLRRDRLKLRERMTFDWFHRLFGTRNKDWDPWEVRAAATRPFTAQEPVRTGQTMRVKGFDAMNELRRKEKTHG